MLYIFQLFVYIFFSAKTSNEGPVVDADGGISFALDEYFDSADKTFPKTEIKEEKPQEIPDNDFNWDMVTVGKYQKNL